MDRTASPKAAMRPKRRSSCLEQSRHHELERLRRMSVEERIKAALSMGDRYAWLRPAPRQGEG